MVLYLPVHGKKIYPHLFSSVQSLADEGRHTSREANSGMRSYRQLTTIIQTMKSGKSNVDKGIDDLVNIYDRIARKGGRGNS